MTPHVDMELTTLISIAIAAALAWPQAPEGANQRIVLLPSADGSPSAVVVQSADGEQLINKPYTGLEVTRYGATQKVPLSERAVRERYTP